MVSLIVNTREAKSRLSELIREAERGHDVIVTRNGQPVAKIIPWPAARSERSPGAWQGQVGYHTDEVGSDADVVELFNRSASAPSP